MSSEGLRRMRLYETHNRKTYLRGFSNCKCFHQLQSRVNSTTPCSKDFSTTVNPPCLLHRLQIRPPEVSPSWYSSHSCRLHWNENADALSKTSSKITPSVIQRDQIPSSTIITGPIRKRARYTSSGCTNRQSGSHYNTRKLHVVDHLFPWTCQYRARQRPESRATHGHRNAE